MWSSLSTAQKKESLAALASARAQTTSESLGGPQQTNEGGLAVHRFTGHVLTDPDPALDGGGARFLYAPSEGDDPIFRAALSAAAGGAVVDYFDAISGTPTVSLMLTYDCVYTWANFAYANNVLMGDNLAAYNDAGGDVVLGVFCTFTSGNFLAGMIMTAAYNPVVSPTGTNHFTTDSYQGDGTTCLYAGAGVPTCTFRDFLVTQGTGVIDGTYFDGEVCHAYRGTNPSGAGTVTYSNGGDGAPLGCTGFVQVIANACLCDPTGGGGGGGTLYAGMGVASPVNPAGVATLNGTTFAGALLGTPTLGGLSGLAFTPDGRLWATVRGSSFFATDLAEINPATGALISQTPIVDTGGSGVRISDLAVQPGTGILYGCGGAFGLIYTINPITAIATLVGDTFLGSDGGLAFDASGTLYLISAAVANPFLATISPVTAAAITVISYGPDVGCDGLLVRPSDGALLATRGQFAGGDLIVGVNPVSGATTPLGSTGVGTSSDLALQPGGTPGSCAFRTGILGTNPNDYSCVNNPRVGQVWQSSIVTTPLLGTSTFATFVAFGIGGPVVGIPLFGFELLVLPAFIVDQSFGGHSILMPANPGFVGTPLFTQGARLETSGPIFFVIMLNGQDLILGS